MNELIINNENLIYHIIKKMNLYHRVEEFYDIGLIGLCYASKKYNSEKGYAFSTFASKCIKNEILREIRKNNFDKCKANFDCISLNQTFSEDNCVEIQELIPSTINIEEDYIKKEQLEEIKEEIKKLSNKEQYIINHIYELDDNKKMNQCEIAKELKVSQAEVSRRLIKIIKKIKNNLE